MALADGRALPASRLAAEAGVAASTISEHLSRLREANLLTAERQGRARYFRLADPSVAEALEAIARISPPEPIRSLRQGSRAHALRQARTCYNHLAGRLGTVLMAALLDGGLLTGGDGRHHPDTASNDRLSAPGTDLTYTLTRNGQQQLTSFGIDLTAVQRRRPAIRYCLDWSEQRHHLAGPLGTAITNRLFDLDWIQRGTTRRVVKLTDAGQHGLHDTFGLPQNWETEPREHPFAALSK
jgi:DNA-binding MarR family transcriptional regulator